LPQRQDFDPGPGLVTNDTTFAANGRWSAGSNVRFWEGKAQSIGGFESLVSTLLTGVCRKAFPWTDVPGQLNIAFGTHTNLEIWYGGSLFDITPLLALPAVTLGANPITTHNTTANVDVAQPAHPYVVGDSIIITGASVVATVTINGTWIVTAVTANTWSFVAGSNANADATGGGSAVVVTPQRPFMAGQIDGTGSSGYSTGAYSVGPYSSISAADYFPRTWSTGAWGGQLLASPRGGTIFQWLNDTTQRATALPGAPAQITQMLVAPNGGGFQVFALGCNQEVSGVFNPMCIRHSSIRNNTEWNTAAGTTAREYVLTGGGRIVGGLMLGEQLMVWTNKAVFIGSFVGSLNQPWNFRHIADHCGLIAPNAAAVLGEAAYWMAPDRQFWRCYMGSVPQPIDCPIRDDFEDNLAFSQADKIIASTCAQFNEVRWDYPDGRDGYENSRYLQVCVVGVDQGAWSSGIMARTAYVDAGPSPSPIGVTYAGNCYWHEAGQSADGNNLSGYIQTADLYLDDSIIATINGVFPDFTDQQGSVNLTMTARMYPQGPETSVGPFMLAVGTQKADFRITGRLFRLRIDFSASPSSFRLGKLSFEYEPSLASR
jgi:hypothetical protein